MQEQYDAKHRQMILVLGMHRSGTSAATGVLACLGAELGGHLIPAADDNPKGFFEHADIFALHQELLRGLGSDWDDTAPLPKDWRTSPVACTAAAKIREVLRRDFAAAELVVVKDPRLCRLVPLWRVVLEDEGFRLKAVLVMRDGFEVVASLVKRDALRPAEAAGLWLRHELEAEAATRGDPRVVVPYTAMLRDWRSEAERIAVALDLKWPRSLKDAGSEIDKLLDSGLRHQRHGADSTFDEQLVPPLADWLNVVYAALTNPAGIETKRLDEITQTLSRMDRSSVFYLAQLQRLRKEVQHWRPEAERVWENHEWLRARVAELEAAAADRNAGLMALQEKLAQEFRRQQTASVEQLTAELPVLREDIERGFRLIRDAVTVQQGATRELGEHLRAKLDDQREMLASGLNALRDQISLTHIECEILRKALLESQRKL